MNKVGKILLKTILGVFALLFIWIIINSIFLGDNVLFSFKPILLFIYIIINMIFLIFIYKNVITKIANYKWLPVFLMAIFAIICILVSYSLRQNPSWDMGRVFNMAVGYIQNGYIEDTYLYEYQNNIAITCIFIIVLKIFSLFNYTDYVTAITLVNAIMVTLTIICLYYSVKKIYGKEKALMVLIICLFTTPFYLHAAIYYTDTMSMFVCTLFLFIYTIMRDENNKTKKYIEQIILGLIFVVGAEIKITSTFIFIAIIVASILNNKIKDLIKDFKIFIPATLIFFLIYTICINTMVIPDKEKLNMYKVPISHWLWIGSVGNGGFNQEAYEYTYSFPTYEERNQADLSKLKETLKSYDIISFVKHISQKLKYTWADGTYLAPEKLRRDPVNKGVLYEYVASGGTKTNYYKYFPQIMHITMLGFLLINVISVLKNKKFDKMDTTLIISILGITLFLMIWENRSRYILTLVPIMIILEVNGIESVAYNLMKKERKQLNEYNGEN